MISNVYFDQSNGPRFEIAEDMFWKDGEPFRIIGGDLHYFRVLPEVFFFFLILIFMVYLFHFYMTSNLKCYNLTIIFMYDVPMVNWKGRQENKSMLAELLFLIPFQRVELSPIGNNRLVRSLKRVKYLSLLVIIICLHPGVCLINLLRLLSVIIILYYILCIVGGVSSNFSKFLMKYPPTFELQIDSLSCLFSFYSLLINLNLIACLHGTLVLGRQTSQSKGIGFEYHSNICSMELT